MSRGSGGGECLAFVMVPECIGGSGVVVGR